MSKRCQPPGRKPGFGNRVSHSHKRSRRRWQPNPQRRRHWLAELRQQGVRV